MGSQKYEEIGPVSHAQADEIFAGNDPHLIARTLIAIGLHDEDWPWVQRLALKYLLHENEAVVSAAILSLAHTARVNRAIDKDLVIPALQSIASDTRFIGRVQDAMDDINMFVKSSSQTS